MWWSSLCWKSGVACCRWNDCRPVMARAWDRLGQRGVSNPRVRQKETATSCSTAHRWLGPFAAHRTSSISAAYRRGSDCQNLIDQVRCSSLKRSRPFRCCHASHRHRPRVRIGRPLTKRATLNLFLKSACGWRPSGRLARNNFPTSSFPFGIPN